MRPRDGEALRLPFALLALSWISPAVANAQSVASESRPSSGAPVPSGEPSSGIGPASFAGTPSSAAASTIEPIAVTATTTESRSSDAADSRSVVIRRERARANTSGQLAPGNSRWEASLGGDFVYSTQLPSNAVFGVPQRVFAADGAIGVRWFVRPVADDDAPRSLQPYLQRTSTISLRAAAFGSDTFVAGTPSATAGFWTRFDFDHYVVPFLAVWGSIETDYAKGVTTATSTLGPSVVTTRAEGYQFALPVSAGLGLRVRETRIDLGYGIAPFETSATSWQVPFWAHAYASLTTVIDRTIALTFAGDVLQWGVRTSARGDLFPTRNLGVSLRAVFARWSTDPRFAVTQLTGAVGVTYWFSSVFGVTAEHTVEWSYATFAVLENRFSVAAFARW